MAHSNPITNGMLAHVDAGKTTVQIAAAAAAAAASSATTPPVAPQPV